MHDKDDGPSDPAKVRATITAALPAGVITLPHFTTTTGADGTSTFPLPNLQPQPVTLYRAINALGGAAHGNEFDRGWNSAVDKALAILTERGFTEQADAINPERFDVTEWPDVRQNALLAAEVIDRWWNDPKSEFTRGDAARAIGTIRQLLAAHDDMEVHRDAARDALSDMRDERDRLTRQLTDRKFERDALFESCERKDARIAQMQFELAAEKGPVAAHATRPEVEILLAGRADLMEAVDSVTKTLEGDAKWIGGEESGFGDVWTNGPARLDGTIQAAQLREAIQLLDRLGAYIVGQDTRLIAAGEALAEADRHNPGLRKTLLAQADAAVAYFHERIAEGRQPN